MPHGIFNAEKCITYLREIGAEIDDALAQSWLDAQKVHRFCRSMKRTAARGWEWWCLNEACQHDWYEESATGRKARSKQGCPRCGHRHLHGSLRWTRSRDGTVRDYRPPAERWKPLNDPPSGQTP